MPKDPTERVEWLLAATAHHPDHEAAALLQVLVHAGTALRCRRAVLDALGDRSDPDAALRVQGEASMAAIALHLAARAAQRCCEDTGEAGPLGRPRLDELVATAEHMRDCVMHWDDKARADSPAFLYVDEREILVLGAGRPAGRGPSAIAGLSWRLFEGRVDRLRRWAEYVLNERLASIDLPLDAEA